MSEKRLINNLQFNVQCSGDGPAFVWGHGLMASMESEDAVDLFDWQDFSKNHRLIRYDARGHGKTQPSFQPGDYHWKNMAKDMIAVSDEFECIQSVFGGQSMGCATAIYAAVLAPEKIKGLVLVNPPTAWETRAEQGAFYKKMARIGGILGGGILAKMMRKKIGRLLPQWLIDAKKDSVEGVLEGLRPLKRKTLSNLFKGAALTDFPSRERLKLIEVPTLILAWAGDQTHPIETAIELDRLLPNSEMIIAKDYDDFLKWPSLIREFIFHKISN